MAGPAAWRAHRTRRKSLDDAEPGDVALNGTAPDATAPGSTAPDGTARDGTALDGTARDGTARDGTALDGTARDGTARDGRAFDATAFDATAFDGTAVAGTTDNGTAVNGTATGSTAPDGASPGETPPPDTHAPGTAADAHSGDARPAAADGGQADSDQGGRDPAAADAPPGRRSRLRTAAGVGLNAVDGILAIGAGVMVVFVHDLKFWLFIPYWLDEAWVADSVRAPLSVVPRLASSTPLGWILLLRLVPHGGLERQRLVPLIFAGLAVSAAYLLGRELGLTRFTAGLLTATAALLSPAMVMRNDLKQYTAEAFGSIVIWLLVARTETKWTRWRLAALAVAASAGALIAETIILTGAAGLACLGLAALVRRQWRRLAEAAVAAVGMLVIYGVVYEIVVKPRINSTLNYTWAPEYAPTSVTGAAAFFWAKLQVLAPFIGFPALHDPRTGLTIALSVAGAGVVALAVMRRFALAALLPVTLVVVMAASAHQSYPFGDERTSTFWLVMFPVLMAIAVAAVPHAIGLGLGWLAGGTGGRPLRTGRRWLKWTLLPVIAIAAAAVAINYYTRAVLPDANSHVLAHDDPRSQVQYAVDHWRAGDVIVIDYGASYGFAYYYTDPATAYLSVPGNAAGWVPEYRDPHVIVMASRQPVEVGRAIVRARAILAAEPPDEHGRIWIIRNHAEPDERLAWRHAFNQLNRGGGHVTLIGLHLLGYLPGYQAVAVYTPPLPPHSR
jgi:hypothetical protein